MSHALVRRTVAALLLVLALAVSFAAMTGCAQKSGSDAGSSGSSGKLAEPAPQEEKKDAPAYTSWQVYINDDASASKGSVNYSIALNLTATNPTPNEAGTYTGTATASTTTEGTVNGMPLEAQAIAQSGNLQFTLEDPSGGGALAPLGTGELPDLQGKGTITMKASGSGHIGAAGGSFGNTSSQPIDLVVSGSDVTLTVVISGDNYTFKGTISGK